MQAAQPYGMPYGAGMIVTIDSITRTLWRWLVPYALVWCLCLWRVLAWPASDMPFGPALDYPRHVWEMILALELLPVLALVPVVWRSKPVYIALALGIFLTMANDLMFFCQTLIRPWSPLVFVTSILSMIKAGFDVWVFSRVAERWDLMVAARTQASGA